MALLPLLAVPVLFQFPDVEDFGRGLRWEVSPLPVSSGAGSGQAADVVSPGDIDGDGRPDLVTIDSLSNNFYSYDHFDLVALSTADGSVLWSVAYLPQPVTATRLETMGDVDGDGIGEILVGAPRWPNTPYQVTGEVLVISGGTGATLHQVAGTRSAEYFGESCAGIGDLDGDGVPDFLVGATEEDLFWTPTPGTGFVAACSGATGQEIYRTVGPSRGTSYSPSLFGTSIAVLSDVDGDGLQDYVVSAPLCARTGMITLHSGADGRLLRRWMGEHTPGDFGYALEALDDLDGDGITEFATIQTAGPGSLESIRIHSPVQAAPLREVPGSMVSYGVGRRLRSVPDVDGDGRRDLLHWYQPAIAGAGKVRLLGSVDLEPVLEVLPPVGSYTDLRQVGLLWRDPLDGVVELVSPTVLPNQGSMDARYFRLRGREELTLEPRRQSVASLPAAVRIGIDLPADHAGQSYLLLMSTEAQGPRQVFGVDVPLGPSPLLTTSLLGAVPGLAGGSGTLDAAGDASASLRVAAPATPGLVGREVHFSALAHVGVLGKAASAPATLRFIP